MAEPDVCAPIDANGNLTADGTRTFEWDARDQIVGIEIGIDRVEHAYDGQRARVSSSLFANSVLQSTTSQVWCDRAICEQRSGSATAAIFDLGTLNSSANFLTRDHLGSARDAASASGSRQGQYDYDPYGRLTMAGSSIGERFGGYSSSQIDTHVLALYRAFDPDLGRWLSEDPAGLEEGPNLNIFVRNRPTVGVDPYGDAECGTCSIAVKCNPVSHSIRFVGAMHCYAEVKLTDGSVWRREGGRNPVNGVDTLTADLNTGPRPGQLAWSENPTNCEKAQCVKNGGGGGNANTPYRLFGNNSSNYLDRVLKSCGYPPIVNIMNRS